LKKAEYTIPAAMSPITVIATTTNPQFPPSFNCGPLGSESGMTILLQKTELEHYARASLNNAVWG
jgi:hypothetical protein